MPLASEKENFPTKIGDIEVSLSCEFNSKRIEDKKKQTKGKQELKQVL